METKNTGADSSDAEIALATAEWDSDPANTPVFAVVSAVADATDEDPLELPPLHDAIDPEALNDLFTGRVGPTVGKVEFQYGGFDVVVHGNGLVQVTRGV